MKDIVLTISLTDPALNLTVKRQVNLGRGDPPGTLCSKTADAIEELHTLLAIAQNQAIPKSPGSPPHCCVCGGVVKSYAGPYHVNPQEICQCPYPPHGMGSSKPLGPPEPLPHWTDVRNFDQPPVRCSIVDCKSVAIWQDCDSNYRPIQYGRRYCAHHALTHSRGVGSIIPFPLP